MSNGAKILVGVLFLVLAVMSVWKEIDDRGWIPQDRRMFVEARNWAMGEYKDCTTQNVNVEEPTLACDAEVGKVFEVRFYGRVSQSSEPATFRWNCQKNEGINPSITCHKK
jgi:hypothetical protein